MPKSTGSRKCEVQVTSYKEYNELVLYAKKRSRALHKPWEQRDKSKESCTIFSFIHETLKWATLTTKFYPGSKGKVKTFKFDKYDEEKVETVKGATVYATLQRYYHAPEFVNDEYVKRMLGWNEELSTFMVSVSAYTYFNPKYTHTRQKMWCYDANSAYAAQLLKDIPDTSHYEIERRVKKGEIGFFFVGEEVHLVKEGHYANFIFKMMPSPYKEFVEKFYKEKKEATTPQEKQRAKDMLLYGIGYYQRKNPFLRYYIVLSWNEYIKSLADKDTMMSNTDSIFSTKPRPDLPIGDEIGQFKLEFEGPVAYIGYTYQKGTQPPHAKGTIRKLFKKGFDLLKDPMPKPKHTDSPYIVLPANDLIYPKGGEYGI